MLVVVSFAVKIFFFLRWAIYPLSEYIIIIINTARIDERLTANFTLVHSNISNLLEDERSISTNTRPVVFDRQRGSRMDLDG